MDLAILFVPAPQVLTALDECAGRGIRGVIVESGGFAETGPEGRKLQDRMVARGGNWGSGSGAPTAWVLSMPFAAMFFLYGSQRLLRGLVPGDVSWSFRAACSLRDSWWTS